MRICVKEESDELPSVPPGFESYATFTLKRRLVPDDQTKANAMESVASVSNQAELETESDEAKAARSLRRRPWINYDDDVAADPNNEKKASPQNLDQVSSLFFFNLLMAYYQQQLVFFLFFLCLVLMHHHVVAELWSEVSSFSTKGCD